MGTNYVLWDCLDVIGRDEMAIKRNLIDVLFYTVTTMGGFGDLAPGSDVGKLLFVVQAGFGLFTVGLFLRWLVRLAIR